MTTNAIVTITGPTGSGKSTLLQYLLTESNSRFGRIKNMTTRAPRAGELEQSDYEFVSKEYFQSQLDAGNLCQFVEFKGNFYGSSLDGVFEMFKAGKIPAIIVEPSGVYQFELAGKKNGFVVYPVFIEAQLEKLTERYLERVVEEARLDTQIDLGYHAKRISSIAGEHESWQPHPSQLAVVVAGNEPTDLHNASLLIKERLKELG